MITALGTVVTILRLRVSLRYYLAEGSLFNRHRHKLTQGLIADAILCASHNVSLMHCRTADENLTEPVKSAGLPCSSCQSARSAAARTLNSTRIFETAISRLATVQKRCNGRPDSTLECPRHLCIARMAQILNCFIELRYAADQVSPQVAALRTAGLRAIFEYRSPPAIMVIALLDR